MRRGLCNGLCVGVYGDGKLLVWGDLWGASCSWAALSLRLLHSRLYRRDAACWVASLPALPCLPCPLLPCPPLTPPLPCREIARARPAHEEGQQAHDAFMANVSASSAARRQGEAAAVMRQNLRIYQRLQVGGWVRGWVREGGREAG